MRGQDESFLEDSRGQLLNAYQAPMFAFTPKPHAGLGVGETRQHMIPGHHDY
jgi:hypothetical protein